MCEKRRYRFKSAEEALRFYFRVRELLRGGRTGRLTADELPADACPASADALDDYKCIGWCMRGLDEVSLWLLSDLYGPTSFGVRRRTFSHACQSSRNQFPGREFRLGQVRSLNQQAVAAVQHELRVLAMISAPTLRDGRDRKGREKSIADRVHI